MVEYAGFMSLLKKQVLNNAPKQAFHLIAAKNAAPGEGKRYVLVQFAFKMIHNSGKINYG